MNYEFIGWAQDQTKNEDKIWGIIKLSGDDWQGTYVSFWGRRGKKLQTKIYKDEYAWTMEKLADQKQDKGYQKIDQSKLDTVYPEFEKDLQKTAVWSMLKC